MEEKEKEEPVYEAIGFIIVMITIVGFIFGTYVLFDKYNYKQCVSRHSLDYYKC